MTIYTFAEGMPCPHCGNAERTILVANGRSSEDAKEPEDTVDPVAGACEACSVELYWAWKRLLADAAPTSGSPADRVSRVKVMVARRKTLRSGVLEPAEISSSYEALMVAMPDGSLDLPTADVGPGELEVEAARRALGEVGVVTWPASLGSLYTAHVPRGSLCRVYLARAYVALEVAAGAPAPSWRSLPLGQHAPAMSGFYLALEDVWPLVLRSPRNPETSEICVGLRRGSLEYIKMQQQIREKIQNVDTSMAEYLRRGMTEDELLVVKALAKEAALGSEVLGDLRAPVKIENLSEETLPEETLPEEERVVLDAEEIPDFDPATDAGGIGGDDE